MVMNAAFNLQRDKAINLTAIKLNVTFDRYIEQNQLQLITKADTEWCTGNSTARRFSPRYGTKQLLPV